MLFPLITFGTESVITSEILRFFRTTVIAESAVRTNFNAVFAFLTFGTYLRTVCTVFSANITDFL